MGRDPTIQKNILCFIYLGGGSGKCAEKIYESIRPSSSTLVTGNAQKSSFHDLEQVVTNIVQVLFYATPIIWMPSLVLGREFYMEYNPFYHVINIIRIPVIDGDMQIWQSSLVVSIALLGCLILLNYYIYRRFSKMVSYWV